MTGSQERPGLGRLVAINASALTIGRLVNAAIGIVTVGITSRYLGVDLYGTLVTVTVFAVLFSSLADLGLWTIGARELAKRPDETRALMGSLFTLSIALSLGAAAVGLATALVVYPGAAGALERESIAILILAPLPLAAAAGPAGAYLVAQQRGYAAAVASTIASVAMALVLVATAALDLGFTAVVIANAAQSIAFAAVMLAYTLPRIRYRPSWDPSLAAPLMRWAIPLGAVVILTSLYWRIDVLLIGLVGSQEDVGIYALAYKVVETLYFLPAFVMLTLLPELARLAEIAERRDELVQKAFTIMQVGAVGLLVFTAAFAEQIVAIAGGSAFDESAVVLRILMLGVAAGYLRAVFTEALIAVNRQLWLLVATGSLLALNVALNLVLIPALGARGAATAFATCELIGVALMFALYRRVGSPPRAYRPAKVLLAGCAMSAVAALQLLPIVEAAGPVAAIVVLGVLSLGAYVGCLHALDAMPREVHTTLVAPLQARLRRSRNTP